MSETPGNQSEPAQQTPNSDIVNLPGSTGGVRDGSEVVLPLVEHVLEPLSRGAGPVVPTWDWLADRPGPALPLTVDDRLVVEGCGASVGAAAPFAGTRVWLDAPAGLRRERAIARDGALFAGHWDMWAAQEEAVFGADGTSSRAHLVLGGADPSDEVSDR